MSRAAFISLDGIDGTGKSTQCRLLADWLNSSGVPTILCADPGGTPLGDQLRQLLLASRVDLSDRAEALLFMASRAELTAKVIRPALDDGKVVLSDRFVAANVVYQGHAHGLSPEELWAVGSFSTGGLFPGLTLILDLPVEVAVTRRGRAADRVEERGVEYLECVRRGFLSEADSHPETFQVIDATPDVERLQQQLQQIVVHHLTGRGIAVKGEL